MVITLAFLVLGTCLYSTCFVFAQTEQSESKMQAANNAVNQAFNAVSDAEKASANITSLITQLNDAACLLAQAENAYRIGDKNTAAAKADNVLTKAQEVTVSGQDAKQAAIAAGQNALWSTVAFTAIGAFAFVLILFFLWRQIRRSYINNLSTAKPEANGQ